MVDHALLKGKGPPLSSVKSLTPHTPSCSRPCYLYTPLTGTHCVPHMTHCVICVSSTDRENLRNLVLLILVSSELMQLQAQRVLNSYLLKK